MVLAIGFQSSSQCTGNVDMHALPTPKPQETIQMTEWIHIMLSRTLSFNEKALKYRKPLDFNFEDVTRSYTWWLHADIVSELVEATFNHEKLKGTY